MGSDEQAIRIGLLQYYSSELTAHGTYLLSIALVFFTAIQTLHGNSIVRLILEPVILAALTAAGVHVLARTLHWGLLANAALWIRKDKVTPKGLNQWKADLSSLAELSRGYAYEKKTYFVEENPKGVSRVTRFVDRYLKHWESYLVIAFVVSWPIYFVSIYTGGI